MDNTEQLISECKAGSRQAQMEIYQLYCKQVFNTCLRLVCNKTDAEDIMQNAFIDAFGKLHKYRGPGVFQAWIKRIAVNNCLDFVAKQKQQPICVDQLPDILTDEPFPDDSETIYRVEEIKIAMEKLHVDYRVALSLHLFEGMDMEEMAQILKLKEGNVRTRLSRAKQALILQIEKLKQSRQLLKKEA